MMLSLINLSLAPRPNATADPHPGDDLLLEQGGDMLQEDNVSTLKTEQSP